METRNPVLVVLAFCGFVLSIATSFWFVDARWVSAEQGPTSDGVAIPEAARQEADTVWKTRCMTCHGETGKGDGPAAAALNPRPRDFTQPSWQSSVTDEHIEKIIREGGQGVGLSLLMPANPDLVSKPDVIKALRAHVRALAAK